MPQRMEGGHLSRKREDLGYQQRWSAVLGLSLFLDAGRLWLSYAGRSLSFCEELLSFCVGRLLLFYEEWWLSRG